MVPPQQWDPKSLVIHLTLSEAHSMGRNEMLGKHFCFSASSYAVVVIQGLMVTFVLVYYLFFPLT